MDEFKETEEPLTLHGLGFLQLKLSARQRLHVWHPALPRRKCFVHSQIHDHRFGFTSRVLVGTQVNRVYSTIRIRQDVDHISSTHISYLHEGTRTKFGNRPWLPQQHYYVSTLYDESIPAGRDYTMPPYAFHSTHPAGDGKVATIMTKTIEHGRGAHSLCAIGVEPDVDFDRKQMSVDEMWRIIRDVMENASR